ncbi:MAG TPA: RNA 2',3'-cyclic phosphodiesterase [Bacilli bacterium]|nr:RNA 2',3'-cyclic phosphodiesterase [Bacilli bacterium]
MRLFLGIKPDKKALLNLQKMIKTLQAQGVSGNYTDINNIHLTLAFIGETADEKTIKTAMEEIVQECFFLKINKIKRFKDMLILEIEKTEELQKLQEGLARELFEKGFNIEKRDFYPHITLVREANKNLEWDLDICSEVRSYELFSSERINGKIKYTVIHKKMLGCENSE